MQDDSLEFYRVEYARIDRVNLDDFAAADLKRENETPQSGGTDPSARAHIAAE